MTDSDQDSLTKLNTLLNASMVLMEDAVDEKPHHSKKDKVVVINTSTQSVKKKHKSRHPRKGILKKKNKIDNDDKENSESKKTSKDVKISVSDKGSLMDSTPPRPRNLTEFKQGDTSIRVYKNKRKMSTFTLGDISDSEDLWIMDIPKTIDPKELCGQTLILGEKTKLKLGNERYHTVYHMDAKSNVTCVFNTSKNKRKLKTANIKPVGSITVRKKLSTTPKAKIVNIKTTGMPFPEKLGVQHPLFGVKHKENGKKQKENRRKTGRKETAVCEEK